jgi:hypothetical protein
MLAVMAYGLDDCLAACASWNMHANQDGCAAIGFNANLDEIPPNTFGTCLLKNSTGQEILPWMINATRGENMVNNIAAARLVRNASLAGNAIAAAGPRVHSLPRIPMP